MTNYERETAIEAAKVAKKEVIIFVFNTSNESTTFELSDKKSAKTRVDEINNTQNGYVSEVLILNVPSETIKHKRKASK